MEAEGNRLTGRVCLSNYFALRVVSSTQEDFNLDVRCC